MIYEDLLAFWLAFLIWEFLTNSLDLSLSSHWKIILFFGKEFLFFSLLLILRKKLYLKSGALSITIERLILVLAFLLFTGDLIFFGFKTALSEYYFGSILALLWFAHYYLLVKLLLYPLTFGYVRILAGLLLPFFLLIGLDESFEFLEFQFPGQFMLSLLFVLILSPYIIIKIWPVKRMLRGFLRGLITDFLGSLGIRLRDFLILPSVGPRFYTAGILGFIPPFRYLFFSSGLLEILDEREILGVVAHEAGHLKGKHGFYLLIVLLSFPLLILNAFYVFILIFSLFFDNHHSLENFLKGPKALYLEIALGVGFILLSYFFFRYIFAFFLRSLEREADLLALCFLKDPQPLISALSKIGEITGQLYRKSWHHYGLWERINYLEYASIHPHVISKHFNRTRRLLILWLALNVMPIVILLSLEVGLASWLLKFFLAFVS